MTEDNEIGLNHFAKEIFHANKAKGFWDKERNIGELLMLVTTELGEAMEAHRKGRMADIDSYKKAIQREKVDPIQEFKLHIKDTFEDEIADAIIRLLDLSGGLGIDIDFHVKEKLSYNRSRPYKHGKNY